MSITHLGGQPGIHGARAELAVVREVATRTDAIVRCADDVAWAGSAATAYREDLGGVLAALVRLAGLLDGAVASIDRFSALVDAEAAGRAR